LKLPDLVKDVEAGKSEVEVDFEGEVDSDFSGDVDLRLFLQLRGGPLEDPGLLFEVNLDVEVLGEKVGLLKEPGEPISLEFELELGIEVEI